MSERIRTQSIEEQPLVRILGGSPLAKRIQRMFRERGFQVEHYSLEELDAIKVDATIAYKQILIGSAWDGDSWKQISECLTSTLPAAKQTIILLDVITPLSEREKPFTAWHRASQKQNKNLQELYTYQNQGTFDKSIFLQDVVAADAGEDDLPFTAIFGESREKLVDPQCNFHPQLESEAIYALENPLLDPRGSDRVLLKGRKIGSERIVSALERHLQTVYNVDVPTLSLPVVVEAVFTKDDHSTLLVPVSQEEILEEIINKHSGILREYKRLQAQKTEIDSNTAESDPGSLPQPKVAQKEATQRAVQTPVVRRTTKPKRYEVKRYKPTSSPEKPESGVSESATDSQESENKSKKTKTHSKRPSARKKQGTETKIDVTPSTEAFEASIQKLFQDKRVDQKTNRLRELAEETYAIVKKNKRKQILFFSGLLVTLISVVGVSLFGALQLSANRLQQHLFSATELIAAAQPSTQPKLESHQEAILRWQGILEPQIELFSPVLPASQTENIQSIRDISQAISSIAEHRSTTKQLGETFYAQLVAQQTGDSFATLQRLSAITQELFQDISTLRASVDGIPTQNDQQEQLKTIKNELDETTQALVSFQQVQPLLPILLGRESRYTYAVLLQDEQELRPTGGFIQAVVLLKVENGILIDSQVFDIYDLDDNEPGSVSPPTDIRRFLGEDTFFLRDSNWDPSFPKTAAEIERRLENILQTEINGVLGMNVAGLESLITATGPVELSQYNETITARNLRERAQFHSEVSLSEDKQNFFPALARAFFAKMQTMDPAKSSGVYSAMYDMLQQKQLLIYLEQTAYQETMQTLGWTGSIFEPPCPTTLSGNACLVDPVLQVEANVGVNKANQDIERDIIHQVILENDQIRHRREITYTNTAQTASWPQGTYRNFLRLYTAPTASLSAASVAGISVENEDLVVREEHGRQVFGALIEVPVQQTKTVSIEYTVPYDEDTREQLTADDGRFAYAFFDQKQPGTENTDLTIRIRHAADFNPRVIAPKAEVVDNTIIFDQDRLDHSFVGVSFGV